MGTGTLRADRKYVPQELWVPSVVKKQSMGWSDWRMHSSGKLCCVVWIDKKPVLLLSSHAQPLSAEGENPIVQRKVKGGCKPIKTVPMHLQYQKNMRGVDSADQL